MALTLPLELPASRPLRSYLGGGSAVEGELVRQGLSPQGARQAALHFAVAARELAGDGFPGDAPVVGLFVPGRVELLGKHVDYGGGRSLLLAVEEGFSVLTTSHGAAFRDVPSGAEATPVVRIGSADANEWMARGPVPGPGGPGPESPPWGGYCRTLWDRMDRDMPGILESCTRRGVTVCFSNSLPQAAGLSSSTALLIASFLGMLSGLPKVEGEGALQSFSSRETLAEYLAAVEGGRDFPLPPLAGGGAPPQAARGTGVRGVGTEGGSQDHLAILCARPGEVVQYGFRPALFQGAVTWPEAWRLVVGASGVRAEKVDGARDAYNRLSREVRQLEKVVGDGAPLGALLDSPSAARDIAMARIRAALPHSGETLSRRLVQFTTEAGELVPEALAAIARRDAWALGEAARRSHVLAREVLANHVPETEALVTLAREAGAVAMSPFGAGFGGAVWGVFPHAGEAGEEGEGPWERWAGSYLDRFPGRRDSARFMEVTPGPPAFCLFPQPVRGARR